MNEYVRVFIWGIIYILFRVPVVKCHEECKEHAREGSNYQDVR